MSDFPRWLFGENIDGKRQFIIHTQEPRFIGEIVDTDDGFNEITKVQFIDEPEFPLPAKKGGKLAKGLARLMREAGEALIKYDKNLDDFTERQKEAEEYEG
jgi:hypothetical protein